MAAKTVLITGTSTGIGRAAAARQAAAGWKVYAGVRKLEDGERLEREIGGDVVPLILDVTDSGQIESALEQIESEVGRLDGLVNNAGIAVAGPVEVLTDEEWRWQFDVNFFSVIELTRAAFDLVARADGRFVHVGSIAGRIAGPGLGPYSASKHALEAFNWALRGELARNTKMTSSLIEPGEIKTAIWDKAHELVDELDDKLEGETRRRYEFLLDGNRGFIEEGAKRGIEPDAVAKAIEHALTAKRPKARYLVGPDAKFGSMLPRLPDRLFVAMMNANDRRLERAGRKHATAHKPR